MSEWIHSPREQFFMQGRERDEAKARTAAGHFLEILKSVRGFTRINAEMGAKMGKAFVRTLVSGCNQFNHKVLQSSIMAILGPDEGPLFISGFLAEFTAAATFTRLNLPTYYPLPEEDLRHGIDWWLDLRKHGRPAAAITAKTVPLREWVGNGVLYPMRHPKDIKTLLDRLIVPENLDIRRDRLDDKTQELRRKIREACETLMASQERYDDTITLFMAIPSPKCEGAGDKLSSLTGQPFPPFLNQVSQAIEKIPLLGTNQVDGLMYN